VARAITPPAPITECPSQHPRTTKTGTRDASAGRQGSEDVSSPSSVRNGAGGSGGCANSARTAGGPWQSPTHHRTSGRPGQAICRKCILLACRPTEPLSMSSPPSSIGRNRSSNGRYWPRSILNAGGASAFGGVGMWGGAAGSGGCQERSGHSSFGGVGRWGLCRSPAPRFCTNRSTTRETVLWSTSNLVPISSCVWPSLCIARMCRSRFSIIPFRCPVVFSCAVRTLHPTSSTISGTTSLA
jgi:hypothetical protein